MADLDQDPHQRRGLKGLQSILSRYDRPLELSTVAVSKTNPRHGDAPQASTKRSEGRRTSAKKNGCPTWSKGFMMEAFEPYAIRDEIQKYQDEHFDLNQINSCRYTQLYPKPRFNPDEGQPHRNDSCNQRSAVSVKQEVHDDSMPRQPHSRPATQSDAQSPIPEWKRVFGSYKNPRGTPLKSKLFLVSLAAAIPCAALTNNPRWLGNGSILAGVISGSSAITLPALPESDDYKALKTFIRILWAVTYLEFMRRAYLALRVPTARPMYLFCSLLLAAHFALGIAGAADSIAEAKSAILAFGPFLTTACAALVYIPFRYRPARATAGEIIPEGGESTGGARNLLEQHGADGDIGLERSVMYGVLGITA